MKNTRDIICINKHTLVSLPLILFQYSQLFFQARLRRDHLAKQAAMMVSDQTYINGGIDIGAGASLTLSDVPAVRALQQVSKQDYDQPRSMSLLFEVFFITPMSLTPMFNNVT